MPSLSESKKKQARKNLDFAVTTLNALKLASGCIDCGFRDHPGALQFDHIDPDTKRRDLGWFRDRSKLTTRARLLRYIEHVQKYCQVRCANCHAIRTISEQHWTLKPVVRSDNYLF